MHRSVRLRAGAQRRRSSDRAGRPPAQDPIPPPSRVLLAARRALREPVQARPAPRRDRPWRTARPARCPRRVRRRVARRCTPTIQPGRLAGAGGSPGCRRMRPARPGRRSLDRSVLARRAAAPRFSRSPRPINEQRPFSDSPLQSRLIFELPAHPFEFGPHRLRLGVAARRVQQLDGLSSASGAVVERHR